jgi:hypothetical protein
MALQFNTDEELVAFVLKQKLPEWQKKLFKKYADAVQVHSQGQIFFKLDRMFPNEAPESKDHRILAFESVTEASFGKGVNNINRIFKNTAYSFEASDKTTEQAAQLFEGDNFFQWFLDEWCTWALKEDANARIAVYPPEYVAEGYEPICFVASEHLIHCDKEAVVFVSEKESKVRYETEEVKIHTVRFYDQSIGRINWRQVQENTFTPKIVSVIEKPVYHAFVAGVGFYRIEQLQNSKTKYQIDFYPFTGDMIPVTDVGGEKSSKDVNKSFMNPFVNFGNLALLQHSQHTAVNFTFSFPRMSEIQSPCDDPLCKDGWIDCEITKECPDGKKTCGKCGGSGLISNQTPYKSYVKRFDPQGMEGDDKILEVPHVQYYTPDVTILDYSKAEWKNYLEMAEKAVYITQEVKTGNIPSAESKNIDRDDLYAFLSRVAKVYYSKIKFVLQSWENYFYSSPAQVTIEVPYSFAILQEDEAFAGLKDILASNVPVMIKANQVESFVNKFLSQNSPIRMFLDVLKIVDPLLFYNNNEITSFKLNGAVTPEQMTAHVYSFPVLQRMYFENPLLFMQETTKIIADLEAQLADMVPEQPVDLKTKLLNASE